MTHASLKPILMILSAYVIWAFDFPLYRMLFPKYISAFSMASFTLVVSGLICWASCLFVPWEKITRSDLYKFAIAGLLIGVFKKSLLMYGMSETTPIDASIIACSGPIMVFLLALVLKIDRASPLKLIGLGLGITGTLLIIFNNSASSDAPHRLWGNLIIFLSTLSVSFYLVWMKEIIQRYKSITLLRGIYLFAALFALPYALYSLETVDFTAFGTAGWALFFFVLLVPTLVPNYLLLASLRFVKPTIVSVYSYTMPILASILAIILHQDTLTWIKVIAGIIVLVGIYLVVHSYAKDPPRNPTQIKPPLHHLN